jgi:protein-S-isoprenylcysteine O-methyltransferase Ste14
MPRGSSIAIARAAHHDRASRSHADVIERVRHFLGVLTVTALPPGLLFWLVIHPWAHRWRKLGPIRTYLIVVPPVVAFGVVLFQLRDWILGADLGTHWSLISTALCLYGVTTWLELQYWRQLSIPTLIGVPELSRAEHFTGKLLKDGAYRMVRHPRYLSAGISIVANALIINSLGVYALILFLFPAGFVMLMFEERELVNRFGEEYRQYQREVPQVLPRVHRAKRD